jgi:hypothetical protein
MPLAWTCITDPERHGSFLQSGLDTLSAIYGGMQPKGRFACPICIALAQPGHMRAATITEADRLFAQHQEA